MFDNDRYATIGFRDIPMDLQLTIFDLIDELKEKMKLDYLQVFELTGEGYVQTIEHRMENPEYNKTYRFVYSDPITAKIFVIDDGTYTTAMLAEEY